MASATIFTGKYPIHWQALKGNCNFSSTVWKMCGGRKKNKLFQWWLGNPECRAGFPAPTFVSRTMPMVCNVIWRALETSRNTEIKALIILKIKTDMIWFYEWIFRKRCMYGYWEVRTTHYCNKHINFIFHFQNVGKPWNEVTPFSQQPKSIKDSNHRVGMHRVENKNPDKSLAVSWLNSWSYRVLAFRGCSRHLTLPQIGHLVDWSQLNLIFHH